jgi:hypothetical protein
MKRITKELVEYINSHDARYHDMHDWHSLRYDGRRKMFRGIAKEDFIAAQKRHLYRVYIRPSEAYYNKSALRKAYEYICDWSKSENGNYQKIAVMGKRHLWAASPRYGFADYNKARLMEIAGHERECEWLIAVSRRIANIN